MNASLSNNIEYKTVCIHPTFEKVHALLADIHLYLFGPDGKLIDEQAVRRGKASLSATEEELRNGSIVVSPNLEDLIFEPITLEAARCHLVFESSLNFDDRLDHYDLPPIPEVIWRWWLVHTLWKNMGGTPLTKSRMLIW